MRKGWKELQLGDVIGLEYGKPLPKKCRQPDGKYPAFGANGVKCRTNELFCEEPSIIVGRKGSAGALHLVEGGFWPLDVTYYVTVDREKFDLKFIYFLLTLLELPKLARGVKPGINRNDVYSIVRRFPSLPEQKRIVAILDEAFAAIETATANAEKNLANAREVFESYNRKTFTHLTKCGVKNVPLGNICGFQNGFAFKSKTFRSRGIPVIRISSLQNEQVSDHRPVFVDPSGYADDLERYLVPNNALLIAMSGATTGKVAFNRTGKTWLLNQRVGRFLPSKDLDIDFLFLLLLQRVEENLAKSAGSAQPNLSTKQIRELQVPLPSLDRQQQIASDLRFVQSESFKITEFAGKKLSLLAELKQSLLHKAFTGELTADRKASERKLEAAAV